MRGRFFTFFQLSVTSVYCDNDGKEILKEREKKSAKAHFWTSIGRLSISLLVYFLV